jgi:cell division protein ZipA
MEENSLRLVLLIVGVVILMGIYFYDVLQRKRTKENQEFDLPASSERVDPVVSSKHSFSAVYDKEASDVGRSDDTSPELSPVDPVVAEPEDIPMAEQALVIQLAVIPNEGEVISGKALLDTFTQLGLEFGDMGIFHCYERQNGEEVQRFHVANIVEPGTFPVGSMTDFESTGIVLFFQTNDLVNPELSFDKMLNAAQQLSQSLNANLKDGDMQELTMSKITAIQSQLLELSRL